MSLRQNVPLSKDKEIFKHTADKTKKINVNPTIRRGGTRL